MYENRAQLYEEMEVEARQLAGLDVNSPEDVAQFADRTYAYLVQHGIREATFPCFGNDRSEESYASISELVAILHPEPGPIRPTSHLPRSTANRMAMELGYRFITDPKVPDTLKDAHRRLACFNPVAQEGWEHIFPVRWAGEDEGLSYTGFVSVAGINHVYSLMLGLMQHGSAVQRQYAERVSRQLFDAYVALDVAQSNAAGGHNIGEFSLCLDDTPTVTATPRLRHLYSMLPEERTAFLITEELRQLEAQGDLDALATQTGKLLIRGLIHKSTAADERYLRAIVYFLLDRKEAGWIKDNPFILGAIEEAQWLVED